MEVIKITEDVAYISHKGKISQNSILSFKNSAKEETRLIVFGFDKNTIKAYVISGPKLTPGLKGTVVKQQTSITLPENLLGTIISPIGDTILDTEKPVIIDGAKSLKEAAIELPLFNPALPIFDRTPVNKNLSTGIFSIDTMIPIGKGQRELIVGDRQTGKTSIALSTAISAAKKGVKIVYASIGQSETNALKIMEKFRENGIEDKVVIVHSNSDDYIGTQYLTPYTAISISELIGSFGNDVLVIFDDLTKHADAYRSLSLLLGKRAGREAYPQDVFYAHSWLLERAGSFSKNGVDWTITALPIVETQKEEVSSYIPTNLISITDGQIITSNQLFLEGLKPAINIGLSVSRVGSAAQTELLKHLGVSKVKINYSIFKQKQKQLLFMGEDDLSAENKVLFHKNGILELMMKQPEEVIYSKEEIAIIVFLLESDYFEGISKQQTVEFVDKLKDFILKGEETEVLKGKLAQEDVDFLSIEYLIKSIFNDFKNGYIKEKGDDEDGK
ncbi:F0F1 ATP synthase subunit alpha [Mycoplasma todarodis]|uniref:F0F1 ATP synthase subunit alpha n=1 Tax=Mycoplasma todarodis TaxID=1937191 RepID=A0A4V2NI96_9MOLU|nr:F0F1 ATP synthase subunit alpha [Mycoplasma todarodis]TCG12066.1 F0F1 ATP synthase subunit alpha [Mycoplasma todarodis]